MRSNQHCSRAVEVTVSSRSADRESTSVLDAINAAIAELASSADPAKRTIAAYLRADDRGGIVPYALGIKGSQGRNITDEVQTAARDRHLRKLHATTTWTIAKICIALTRYRTDVWPRVMMSGQNPHSKDDPHYLIYEMLICKPQALSESRIRNILKADD
jgi:hypothetical protein